MLCFFVQGKQHKEKEEIMDGGECDDLASAVTKDTESSKPESPFSTLVKMNTGKNPTTFSLPPELQCNTFFPGKLCCFSLSDCDIEAFIRNL